MTRFSRLDVINALLDIVLVPLFYNNDLETSVDLAATGSRGEARLIELTNRGTRARNDADHTKEKKQ